MEGYFINKIIINTFAFNGVHDKIAVGFQKTKKDERGLSHSK